MGEREISKELKKAKERNEGNKKGGRTKGGGQ